MNHLLSPRLFQCAKLVAPGDRVADVGCDHGYLGIHLLQNNIASYVYAGDVNEGPLQSAVLNAKRYGVNDKISFYLSDGVKNMPRDFDTLVCAGMGADTMISVLEAAPWLRDFRYRMILQCQSKIHILRKYLSENGWRISRETVLRDGRFLYTVMEILYQPGCTLTPGQWYFPPALLHQATPALHEYYQQVIFRLERAVTGQKENADPIMVQALTELKSDSSLQFLKEEYHDNG